MAFKDASEAFFGILFILLHIAEVSLLFSNVPSCQDENGCYKCTLSKEERRGRRKTKGKGKHDLPIFKLVSIYQAKLRRSGGHGAAAAAAARGWRTEKARNEGSSVHCLETSTQRERDNMIIFLRVAFVRETLPSDDCRHNERCEL